MEELNKPVKVVEILNPFRPADERKETILDAKLGETPSAALVRAGVNPDDYEISVKGEILPPEKANSLAISPGDEILILPALESGFWGELGMLAMMAGLSILTAGIGGAIFGAASVSALGMSFGTTEAMLLGGAMALGGAALMAWSVLGISTQGPMLPSATYDPTGQKQLARAGVPVPKGYGTFAWKGNFISNYADFEGKDQYDCVLACFGFGKAKSITNILLNGRPANQYRDVGVWTRLGTNDQTPIPGFNKTVNTYPQETELLNSSGPTVVPGTGTDVQALQIGIKFPGGLIRYDNHGNPKEVSYAYKVEVSPHGQNQWTAPIFPRTTSDVVTTNTNGYQTYPYWVVIPTDRFSGSGIVYSTDTNVGAHYPGEPWTATQSVKVYDVNNTNTTENVTLTGEWQPCDPNLDQQHVTDWWGGWRIVSAMTPSAFFDVCNVYGLTAGQWDARITFWGAGPHNQSIPEGDVTDGHYQASGWLWYINELAFTDFAYPNMILVGIRAKTSGQISGASLNIQATIEHDLGEDTVLPAQLSGFETDNPAIAAYDLITNPLYGMGYDAKYVDIPSFVAWATNNDLTRTNSDTTTVRQWIFNGVFDQSGDGWTALQKIGTMSSCVVGMPGGKFTAILDAPDSPVQLFNVNNIAKDSFKESWVSLDNRTNLIEATFADAARNYRMDLPVSVMTADDIQSGIPARSTRTSLLGCTSRDQAWRWCYQQLLHTKLALRSISFKTNLSGIACRTGNLIAVQHDVPQWAYGGLVQPGSTASAVIIDRTDLPAFTGTGWTLSVQHPTLLRGTATIASVTAGAVNTVTLSAAPPPARILRLVSSDGSFETSIRGVTGDVLEVDSLGALSAGQTVNLYDQDVIEIAVVTAVNGTTVTVQTPFSQTPAEDAPYAYGQSNDTQPAKIFRVTKMTRSGDWSVSIDAVEYQPTVYEPQIPDYGLVVGAPLVSAPITDLTLALVYQNGAVAGNTSGATLSIGWVNGPGTKGAQVEISINGATLQFAARVVGSEYQMPIATGVTVEVRVTGYDSLGVLDPNDAQTATLDTTAAVTTADIPAPTNLTIEDDTTTVVTLADGTTVPRMLVSWTPPNDPAAAKIQVQYQFATSNSVQPVFLNPTLDSTTNTYQSTWVDGGTVDASATSLFVDGIQTFEYENINVRIRSVRNSGAVSAWVETGNHTQLVKYPSWPIAGSGGPTLTFADSGKTLAELEPAEAGADVTGSNNAAGVQAGNKFRLAQDMIDSINPGGGLNFATPGHTGTLDFSTYIAGRTADRVTYTNGGATVDSLQPSQAGADVTGQNTANDTTSVAGVPAGTISQGASGINTNLIPDSDFKFGSVYWSLATGMQLANTSASAGTGQVVWDAGYTGGNSLSAEIPVYAGHVYTLSGYIDAASATAGSTPNWNVYFSDGSYGAGAYQSAGSKGRVSFTFTVPSGVSSLQVNFGGSKNSSDRIWFLTPMLQVGSVATAYQPSLLDNTTGYFKAGASQIDLASGIHLNKTLDYVGDGSTYQRPLYIQNGVYKRSTGIAQQGSLASVSEGGDGSICSAEANDAQIKITWVAFDIYTPDGTVYSIPANTAGQTFTGLSASTTYYFAAWYDIATQLVNIAIIGTSPAGLQYQVQTVQGDGHVGIAINFTFQTTSSSTTTSSGSPTPPAAGTCFSPETLVRVPTLLGTRSVPIAEICAGDKVVTLAGTRRTVFFVSRIRYKGLMCVIPGVGLSTPTHQMWDGSHWVDAKELYPKQVSYDGWIHNLHIDAVENDEHSYTLANGQIVHNIFTSA